MFRLQQLLRVIAALHRPLPWRVPSVPTDAPLPLARRLLPRSRLVSNLPSTLPTLTSRLLTRWHMPRAVDRRGIEPVDDAGENGPATVPLADPPQHSTRLSLHACPLGVAHQRDCDP